VFDIVPFIKDVIQEKSINHHDKLGNHSNPHTATTTGTTAKNKAKETVASRPNWWLKRIHSLKGTSSRYNRHLRTMSNPAY
jgi:hypothetical protein